MSEPEEDGVEEVVNDIADILCAEETDPDWLLPGVLTQGSLNLLVGDPGVGKSYMGYALAISVATGCPLFGGLIPAREPKVVLYFDEENSKQDRDKYLRRAWKGLAALNGGELPDIGLLHKNLWPRRCALGGEDWAEKAADWIGKKQPHYMVFDTANPCFNVEDENNNGQASRILKDLRNLMMIPTDHTATSKVIKHAKTRTEAGRRQVRGAKGWTGTADSVMFMVMAPGRPRVDGLKLTRLEPDKTRAYGLERPIYITPEWHDGKNALSLMGSYDPTREHKRAEVEEEEALRAKAKKK